MGWYSYLLGYLVVIIEGEFPEKVINMALARGIFLWNIKSIEKNKILLKVRIPAFRPLRHIVKYNNCHMKIYKKRGLPFKISWLKRRKGLVIGSLIFFISMYILSSFVWFIEITGTEHVKSSEIEDLAKEYGIKKGVSIRNLNLDELEIEMAESHPKLAWVGIDREGTKITIKVAEKNPVPETSDHKKGHLIASRSGTIEEMLILLGTPLVEEGDKVSKGQVLVSGLVYPEIKVNEDGTQTLEGTPELVKARGVIRAKVPHVSRVSWPLEKEKYVKTGKEEKQIILKMKDKEIILKGPKSLSYKYYEKKSKSKNILPWRKTENSIEIVSNIYYETEKKKEYYGYEGAYKRAVNKASQNIQKTITRDMKVLEKKVNLCSQKDSEIVKVEVIWYCLENIAISKVTDVEEIVKDDK